MTEHTWEQSVEKARLALVKTFEGRVEAALASIEQIPLGQGRNRDGEPTVAQFALDAGIEYVVLREYRQVTKWLGEMSADADFSADTARYRLGDIKVYSLAREGMNAGKWRNGTLFATFLDANTPPEPFARWTVDALRVHLGQRPTNTGKVALAIAAGENVTLDDEREASALDHAAQSAQDLAGIKSSLTRTVAGMKARSIIRESNPDAGIEHVEIVRGLDDMYGPMSHAHYLARQYAEAVRESAAWLNVHGGEVVGGGTDDPDDRPERTWDIARDAFREDLGLIQDALTEVGVGTSITEGFDALLNG